MLAISFFAGPSLARTVDPGDIPQLGPDEGLLLVEVDTTVALDSVRVKQEGRFFAAGTLRQLKPGENTALYVVPAGNYQWAEINTSWYTRFALKDDVEFHFHVEPGKITYAGDLLFRPDGAYWATVAAPNRGLRAMDWLEKNHPALAKQYDFQYSGHYQDPFPDFYRKARATSTASTEELEAVDKPPTPARLPLSPRTLWRSDRITGMDLNPQGDLIAESLQLDETHWALDLIDLNNGTSVRLLGSPAPVRSITWSGDRVLIAGCAIDEGPEVVNVFRIGDSKAGKRSFEVGRVHEPGFVMSTIADDPGHVLYASVGADHILVHRLDVSSLRAIAEFSPAEYTRLNVGVKKDLQWWADGHGGLALAIAKTGDSYSLLRRSAAGFVPVMKLDGDWKFEPQQLSMDGNLLFALSDEDRAQRDLVVFDPAQNRITKTLFSKPGVDITAAVFDDDRNPIGVSYYEEGRKVTEYFDATTEAMARLLERTFPGETVKVRTRNRDGSQLVLQVESSDHAPMLYHLDVSHRQAELLGSVDPWLDSQVFAPTRVLKVTAADGLPIEAYLTLPAGAGKRPLVVLPHGGPVGVSDNVLFDRQVQFFASLGYAVLRVNYRGSDGYGKAFREAGYHVQGTKIEDDIDAAINTALATGALDADRLCIVGSSYGGYSALVSAIRWPNRFRCAVSFAGISDRMLFFTASDGGESKEGRKLLERIVGDPATESGEMLASSPLYHYRDLLVPVMLVHGKEDRRVDYEHSRRLVRMLNLAGHKPVMLSLDKGTHSWGDIDQIDSIFSGMAGFLERYLDAAPAPHPDALETAASQTPVIAHQ